jgi:hypothetical protein
VESVMIEALVARQIAEMRADVVRHLPSGHRANANRHRRRRVPPRTVVIYIPKLPRRSQRRNLHVDEPHKIISHGARSSDGS